MEVAWQNKIWKICNSNVLSVLLYGAECWRVTQRGGRRIVEENEASHEKRGGERTKLKWKKKSRDDVEQSREDYHRQRVVVISGLILICATQALRGSCHRDALLFLFDFHSYIIRTVNFRFCLRNILVQCLVLLTCLKMELNLGIGRLLFTRYIEMIVLTDTLTNSTLIRSHNRGPDYGWLDDPDPDFDAIPEYEDACWVSGE